MMQNLDSLRVEMETYLEEHDFVVFYGYSRMLDSLPIVYWDVTQRPDYREFLDVARRADVKMVVYHQHEFTPEHLDDALSRLDGAEMPRDEHRTIERRLREMRMYEGFLCALELSFDYEGRVYLFDLRTDWYEELSDILDEIEAATPDQDETDQGSFGGYFSKN